MLTENKEKFLKELAEKLVDARGIHRDYISCIMGMWAETFRLSINKNPFPKDSEEGLYWHIGWRASEKASRMKV